jgi:murein DD-endopeptidase MepM/ murein hydrolase activator NlpD
MQTSTDTKNKTKGSRNLQRLRHIAVALVFGISFLGVSPFLTTAGTIDDLRREQEAARQRLDELNAEIKKQQQEINKLVSEANTLQKQVAIFNAQINQTTAQINATEARIQITNSEIARLSADIAQKEAEIQKTREILAGLIRELYQMDRSNSAVLALVNNDNLSDFLNAVAQIENVQGQSYELLQQIKSLKTKLEESRTLAERERDELKVLQSQLLDQRVVLDNQARQKNDLLAITRGQESVYRQLLAKNQQEEDKIEREIRDLENQIRVRLGQRASPGSKGIFYWPMSGTITQRYGNTGFTALGYNFHNGLDIAAPAGTPIYAAADGVVLATGTGEMAYGNWVVVRHDNINGRSVVTLYAHLLRISVSKGQDVKGGTTIVGTEGNTGNTTRLLYGPHRGFHLHFTVFDYEGFQIVPGAHGNYQVPIGYTYDPMDFL